MLNIYLAGAIRDGNLEEDVKWREDLITMVEEDYPSDVCILNPLGNKTLDRRVTPGRWEVGGKVINSNKGIFQQDTWSVRHADILVSNFTSMVSGYPSIGTVMETAGAFFLGGKLVYSIIDPSFSGHGNPGAFKGLHPFLEQVSTEVFSTTEAAIAFLKVHLGMLTGRKPRFGGIITEAGYGHGV